VSAALPAATGLRDPAGQIAGPDFGSVLIAVGLWQAVFLIALRGWPIHTITRRPGRLLAGNALVIGLGALSYLGLHNLAHWPPDAISAACGCAISATLIVAMLFGNWPAAQLPAASGRTVSLVLIALVAIALNRALAAYAYNVPWARATRRLDHHRHAQLYRSRHHLARGHRAALAIRPESQVLKDSQVAGGLHDSCLVLVPADLAAFELTQSLSRSWSSSTSRARSHRPTTVRGPVRQVHWRRTIFAKASVSGQTDLLQLQMTAIGAGNLTIIRL